MSYSRRYIVARSTCVLRSIICVLSTFQPLCTHIMTLFTACLQLHFRRWIGGIFKTTEFTYHRIVLNLLFFLLTLRQEEKCVRRAPIHRHPKVELQAAPSYIVVFTTKTIKLTTQNEKKRKSFTFVVWNLCLQRVVPVSISLVFCKIIEDTSTFNVDAFAEESFSSLWLCRYSSDFSAFSRRTDQIAPKHF